MNEPPLAPVAPTVSAGAGSLSVSWMASVNSGRPAIKSYDLQYREGSSGTWTPGPQNVTTTSATITGLSASTTYQVQVRATNADGDGLWSPSWTGPTGAAQAPGPPRNLRTTPGNGQVTLSWDSPRSTGGAAITDYEYQVDGEGGWISIGSSNRTHTITGLTNGRTYTFRVRAVNRIGRSRASYRAEGTPGAVLDLAHFANGDGITSEIVFLNVSSHPTRPALYFYDPGGDLMDPASVVDVTLDLEIQEDGSLTVRTEMEPLGELTIRTHGETIWCRDR